MTLVAKCRRHRVSACHVSTVLSVFLLRADFPGELVLVGKDDGDGLAQGVYWIAPHKCKGVRSGPVPHDYGEKGGGRG